jgi:AT hook motif
MVFLMFETPTIDIQEIRSTLTEAGNTAAGFAVLAAKRANDLRLDATSRYSSQINEFRKQALVVVNRVESVRADMEAAVEPTLTKVLDRLPAPAAKVAAQAQEAVKSFQVKAHDMVVDALTAEVPVTKTAAPKTATPKTATAKTTAAAKKTVKTKAAVARKVGRPSKAEVAARAGVAAPAASVKAAKPAAKKVARAAKPATVRKVGRPAKAKA